MNYYNPDWLVAYIPNTGKYTLKKSKNEKNTKIQYILWKLLSPFRNKKYILYNHIHDKRRGTKDTLPRKKTLNWKAPIVIGIANKKMTNQGIANAYDVLDLVLSI